MDLWRKLFIYSILPFIRNSSIQNSQASGTYLHSYLSTNWQPECEATGNDPEQPEPQATGKRSSLEVTLGVDEVDSDPMFVYPVEDLFERRPTCSLEPNREYESSFQDGDLIIGGILQLSLSSRSKMLPTFKEREIGPQCLLHLLAFMFAIEEINRSSDILPNVTLGFQIYDSCMIENAALQSALSIISGKKTFVPNYGCQNNSTLVALIGHSLPASSLSIASVSGLYKYPQISYGALDPIFSDRLQFPSFYRTVPNERPQYKAIILLLKHFGWNWVGIVMSKDISSQRTSIELQDAILESGICIEFAISVSNNDDQTNKFKHYQILWESRCNVVIFYSNSNDVIHLLTEIKGLKKVWIIPAMFHIVTDLDSYSTFNGSLFFRFHKREIPSLRDYLLLPDPWKYSDNTFLRIISQEHCLFLFENSSDCAEKKVLSDMDPSVYDVNNFRFTFNVYSAVYSVAHALHDMYVHKNHRVTESTTQKWSWQPWQINPYLKNVRFKTPGGEEVYFDDERNLPGGFDIVNDFWLPNNTVKQVHVGYFNQVDGEDQLFINGSAIQWDPQFSNTPCSVCSESCLPGYRKANQEERPKCCYDCIPCPEGEITNETDMKSCWRCPEDHWSNPRRDKCIPRVVDFLSYADRLGLTLAITAVSFSLVTVAVLGIFIKYKDTPIVKANNQKISFTLLISLILSFLCPFLFIGHSTTISCLLQQVTFGTIFTIAVSSVLSKTIIVVLAFHSTKPHQKMSVWFGKHVSTSLLLFCSFGEVVICAAWLSYSPPFPDYNTQVEVGKIILQCNEGSITAFYFVIGYVGFLACLSFVVAFLARKLPDSFNEAQYITFSMLVFCSVWVSFIPAYLSTKGKYMVAVEVFAILASGAGLLGFIFFPKCYFILIRPELNVRVNLKMEMQANKYK
ncbi:vomeronasal type-2 receptor 26-like [Discoglossus pictus]